jgi:hypothetical protein
MRLQHPGVWYSDCHGRIQDGPASIVPVLHRQRRHIYRHFCRGVPGLCKPQLRMRGPLVALPRLNCRPILTRPCVGPSFPAPAASQSTACSQYCSSIVLRLNPHSALPPQTLLLLLPQAHCILQSKQYQLHNAPIMWLAGAATRAPPPH